MGVQKYVYENEEERQAIYKRSRRDIANRLKNHLSNFAYETIGEMVHGGKRGDPKSMQLIKAVNRNTFKVDKVAGNVEGFETTIDELKETVRRLEETVELLVANVQALKSAEFNKPRMGDKKVCCLEMGGVCNCE